MTLQVGSFQLKYSACQFWWPQVLQKRKISPTDNLGKTWLQDRTTEGNNTVMMQPRIFQYRGVSLDTSINISSKTHKRKGKISEVFLPDTSNEKLNQLICRVTGFFFLKSWLIFSFFKKSSEDLPHPIYVPATSSSASVPNVVYVIGECFNYC